MMAQEISGSDTNSTAPSAQGAQFESYGSLALGAAVFSRKGHVHIPAHGSS